MAVGLHHYMRHSCVKSDGPVHAQHLLINGCGGAFLHPTHVFGKFKELDGISHECKAAYPSFEDSSRCDLNHILQDDSFSSQLRSSFCTVGNGFLYILEHSWASLVGAILLLIAAYCFVPPKVSWKKRANYWSSSCYCSTNCRSDSYVNCGTLLRNLYQT